jgi:hypothetical protein
MSVQQEQTKFMKQNIVKPIPRQTPACYETSEAPMNAKCTFTFNMVCWLLSGVMLLNELCNNMLHIWRQIEECSSSGHSIDLEMMFACADEHQYGADMHLFKKFP